MCVSGITPNHSTSPRGVCVCVLCVCVYSRERTLWDSSGGILRENLCRKKLAGQKQVLSTGLESRALRRPACGDRPDLVAVISIVVAVAAVADIARLLGGESKS